jgi:hypothetical protein
MKGLETSVAFSSETMHDLWGSFSESYNLRYISLRTVLLFFRHRGGPSACVFRAFATVIGNFRHNSADARLCRPGFGKTPPGQFNIGVDQQHILPASGGNAGPLYLLLPDVAGESCWEHRMRAIISISPKDAIAARTASSALFQTGEFWDAPPKCECAA